MSLAATLYVFDQRYGSHVRKLVMIALADFADEHGRAWPSIDTLAARAECSRRSVQEHIRALEADGHLQLQPNAGPRGTNVYRIVFSKKPEKSPSEGVQDLRPTVQKPANTAAAQTAGGGANERRLPAPEPSGTYKEPQEGERADARERSPSPPASNLLADAEDAALWRNLTRCFPDAPTAVSRAEAEILPEILPHLHELTAGDWQAIRAWNDAPDRVRGRKRWPRDRAEFLAHYFEAIQKIRPWWRTTGKRWWTERQAKPSRAKAPAPTHTPATAEEIAAILGTPPF